MKKPIKNQNGSSLDLNIKNKKHNSSRIKVKGREFSGSSTRPRFLATKIMTHKKKSWYIVSNQNWRIIKKHPVKDC